MARQSEKDAEQKAKSEAVARAAHLLNKVISQQKLWRQYRDLYDPAQPDKPGVYEWQREFHDLGVEYKQRCLVAANQVGKSRCGAAELAIHATGEYPPWWKGRRFTKGIKAWAGSTSNEKSRDIVQEALLGPVGQWGTGWIPEARLWGKPKLRQAGIPDVVDSFHVQHKSGDISVVRLKSYEQGREAWQGTTQDLIWFDEEPPWNIYTEGLTRTVASGGMIYLTFTPLLGVSEVVFHFLHAKPEAKVIVKNVTWDDAPHLKEEEKERLKANYSESEIETRTRGTPLMGQGLVFQIPDDQILCDPFKLPDWYRRINGHDFGIGHPAATAYLAVDPESDTVYLYDCYKAAGQTPVYHAAAIMKYGDWIPTAWPRDGLQRDKGSGQALVDIYRNADSRIYMLRENAHYSDERGEHVEPGLLEMLDYMKTGKFKVFRGICEPFMEEKRFFHRDEKTALVKIRDDIISAARYAFVMRRHATTKPTKVARLQPPKVPMMGRR